MKSLHQLKASRSQLLERFCWPALNSRLSAKCSLACHFVAAVRPLDAAGRMTDVGEKGVRTVDGLHGIAGLVTPREICRDDCNTPGDSGV